MAVTFDELTGISPTGSLTRDGGSVQRIAHIAWGSIADLYDDLFPPAILGVPQAPALYTGVPGLDGLYADTLNFEPPHADDYTRGGASGPPDYELARVTIGYKSIPYQQEGDNLITRRIGVSGEMMTLPNVGFRWDDVNGPPILNPEVTAGKLIAMIEHSITLHRVEVVDYASVRDLIGAVNDSAFEGAAPEIILFNGVDLRQSITTQGAQPWEVELRFLEKRINDAALGIVGWNYIFDVSTSKFRRIVTKDGDPIYPLKDMDGLL